MLEQAPGCDANYLFDFVACALSAPLSTPTSSSPAWILTADTATSDNFSSAAFSSSSVASNKSAASSHPRVSAN